MGKGVNREYADKSNNHAKTAIFEDMERAWGEVSINIAVCDTIHRVHCDSSNGFDDY